MPVLVVRRSPTPELLRQTGGHRCRVEQWVSRLAVVGLIACGAATSSSWLPMVRVPDTSRLRDLRYLPGVLAPAIRGIGVAYPRRTAYCLYGSVVQDTITVTATHQAAIARADEWEITYRGRPCEGPVLGMILGRMVQGPCLTTEADDLMFFRDERLLVVIVLCADGVAYYRARHTDWWGRWHPASAPSWRS